MFVHSDSASLNDITFVVFHLSVFQLMLSIILFDVVLITEISLASRTFGGEAVISKHSLAPSTSHYCIPQYLKKKSNLSLKNSSINNEINYSKHFYLRCFFFLKKNVIILLIKVLERLNQIFILSSGE